MEKHWKRIYRKYACLYRKYYARCMFVQCRNIAQIMSDIQKGYGLQAPRTWAYDGK